MGLPNLLCSQPQKVSLSLVGLERGRVRPREMNRLDWLKSGRGMCVSGPWMRKSLQDISLVLYGVVMHSGRSRRSLTFPFNSTGGGREKGSQSH